MSKSALPAGRSRYLTPGHITFFRAAMEGVDLRRAWDYVELDEDEFSPQLAKATIDWIRETTMAACMSAGHPELTALFRRDPNLVKVDTLPSIEEFIAEHEHGDAFSESEMMELYTEKYGANRAGERRSRLQSRLRQAFDILAKAVYRAPRASDTAAQWLAPHLVPHLQAAGMRTLADVRRALNKKKTARWDEVPGIGEKWATRLTRWMDEHVIVVPSEIKKAEYALILTSPFNLSIPESQLTPLTPLTSVTQVANPGTWSPYPASCNRIGASSDVHAIKIWLDAKAPMKPGESRMPPTRRAYSRIAERFLMWCQHEANTTLSQFRVENCIHYRAWLHDLGRKSKEEWAAAGWRIPANEWLGRRGIDRDSPEWRPFEGALSKQSVAQEITVVRALFKFLTDGGVTEHNPWTLMGKANFNAPFAAQGNQFASRGLTQEQRDYLLAGLDVDDELESRLSLVLWLGFGCGLRSAEMIGLSFEDIKITPDSWALSVLGKGGKLRRVPLSSPIKTALLRYMSTIGIPLETVIRASSGLDSESAGQPILRTQRGRRARDLDGNKVMLTPKNRMSYQSLNRVIKDHLESKSRNLEVTNPVSAARLKSASTHWLRHSCAQQALRNGVPLNGVQRLLGHSSLSVTGRYLTADDEALASAMEAFLAPG
jgi:site-specific recombinase XerD